MRSVTILVSLAIVSAVVVGCGGGGGGGTPVQSGFVLTGTIMEQSANVPVNHAIVTLDTQQVQTNASGHFTLSMPIRPVVQVLTVDGFTSAQPQCFKWYAVYNAQAYETLGPGLPVEIPLPLFGANGGNLGTIYLLDAQQQPPAPF